MLKDIRSFPHSNPTNAMHSKQRLAGIDLFRGIAIFAVVILHSDEGITNNSTGWLMILSLAKFAVPFFLATAFYLSVGKLYSTEKPYPLKVRLVRLIVPYIVWTLIYVLYKTFKYWIAHKPDKILGVYHDPVSLIFFGGAEFHLYFLPLLIIGTLLIKPSENLIRRHVSLKVLSFLGILSFAIYGLIDITGNSFQLGSYTAFQPLLNQIFPAGNTNPLVRLLLGELAWIIRCAPYLFVSMILNHPMVEGKLSKLVSNYTAVWFIVFLALNALGSFFLPEFLYEVTVGYAALLFAISLSKQLSDSRVIANLGVCSFGIYLMHLLVVEVFQMISLRVFPAVSTRSSIVVLLSLTLFSFLISWLATALLVTKKPASRFLFGA